MLVRQRPDELSNRAVTLHVTELSLAMSRHWQDKSGMIQDDVLVFALKVHIWTTDKDEVALL